MVVKIFYYRYNHIVSWLSEPVLTLWAPITSNPPRFNQSDRSPGPIKLMMPDFYASCK